MSPPTRSDCASVPCRRSRLFGLLSRIITTAEGSSMRRVHPLRFRQRSTINPPQIRCPSLSELSALIHRALVLRHSRWRTTLVHSIAKFIRNLPSPGLQHVVPRSPSAHFQTTRSNSTKRAAQTLPPLSPERALQVRPSIAPLRQAVRGRPAASPSMWRSLLRLPPLQTLLVTMELLVLHVSRQIFDRHTRSK